MAMAEDLSFSEPWTMSDVVLVVEEQRFHVHRSILAMWSPVFEVMFSSDFKEKNQQEIPLPGKKADEIKQLLLVIYNRSVAKPIMDENVYYLLDIAKEYQMDDVTNHCENYLINIKNRNKQQLASQSFYLDMLVNQAQAFGLKKLRDHCISEVAELMLLSQLKAHKNYEQITLDNVKKIYELMLAYYESR